VMPSQNCLQQNRRGINFSVLHLPGVKENMRLMYMKMCDAPLEYSDAQRKVKGRARFWARPA
jgi:hypothetical protein